MLGLCDELGRRGSADAGGLGRAPAGLRARRAREEWAAGEGERAGKKRRVGLPPVFLGLTGSCRVGLVPVLGWVLGLVGFGVLVSFLFLTQLKSKELKLI